jgi:hypothetical protein
MHPRTRAALLGLGFPTDLIERIALQNHTVDALRTLSPAALRQMYAEEEAQLISEKIRRRPIPEAIVREVLSLAGEACCYCGDGNTAQPSQLHHINPYSVSQDHSVDNLLVVCPTHHVVVHRDGYSAEWQKADRQAWQAVVEIAKTYAGRGLDFPYGAFVALGYAGAPNVQALVRDFVASPAVALRTSTHPLADRALARLRAAHHLEVVGLSGSGKTTLAMGVAGRLAESGFRVFMYRPSLEDPRSAVREVLGFLGVAVQPVALILDDINRWGSQDDLRRLAAATSETRVMISTWTRDTLADRPEVERVFPDHLLIQWSELSPTVVTLLLEHEAEVIAALEEFRRYTPGPQLGLGVFGAGLQELIDRYEDEARTVSEFLFLLRGGEEIARREIALLADHERTDVPVLCAAIEQIAGFEATVTPETVADRCARIPLPGNLPAATAEWAKDVFDAQCDRGRMVRLRGRYRTVHRDWARLLILAALDNDRARDPTTALLEWEFALPTAQPLRVIRLWSWVSAESGHPFIRGWTRSLTDADWSFLVSSSADEGMEALGPLARLVHRFATGPAKERFGPIFAANETGIAAAIRGARLESWYELKELAITVAGSDDGTLSRVLDACPPTEAARLLSQTHPDYYDAASWFFAVASEVNPEWCEAVGQDLDRDELRGRFLQVGAGDFDALFRFYDILVKFRVPLLRSMIRSLTEALESAAARSSLHDLRPGFFSIFGYILRLFPDDFFRIASALDPERYAASLSQSLPRRWRVLGELKGFITPGDVDFYQRVVDLLGEEFVAVVARYGPTHAYELRCLLWVLGEGSEGQRRWLAAVMRESVAAACRARVDESTDLIRAFLKLDRQLAEEMAAELGVSVAERDARQRESSSERDEQFHRWQERFKELDRMGDDYLIPPEALPHSDS